MLTPCTGSLCPSKADALHQQHLCCLCPWQVLAGSRDRRWLRFSPLLPLQVCRASQELCPGNAACPACCCCWGCSAGALTPLGTSHSRSWDTEGEVLICHSHSPKPSSALQKLLFLLTLLLEQMSPVSAVCLHSDSLSLGFLQGHAEEGERKAMWGLWSQPGHPQLVKDTEASSR